MNDSQINEVLSILLNAEHPPSTKMLWPLGPSIALPTSENEPEKDRGKYASAVSIGKSRASIEACAICPQTPTQPRPMHNCPSEARRRSRRGMNNRPTAVKASAPT